jgi:hypothetical protein
LLTEAAASECPVSVIPSTGKSCSLSQTSVGYGIFVLQAPLFAGGEVFLWAESAFSRQSNGVRNHSKFSMDNGFVGPTFAFYHPNCSYKAYYSESGHNVDVDLYGNFYLAESASSSFGNPSKDVCSGLFRFPLAGGSIPDWSFNLSDALPFVFPGNGAPSSVLALDRTRKIIYLAVQCGSSIFKLQDNGALPPTLLGTFVTNSSLSFVALKVDDVTGNVAAITSIAGHVRVFFFLLRTPCSFFFPV